MAVTLNYLATTLIWGSTWYVISFQQAGAAQEVSVAIRFLIAAALLVIWGAVARRRLAIAREHYLWVFVQGLLLFSANYICVYFATPLITTGLIAVVFGLIIPFNIIHERIFFKTPLSVPLLFSATLGLIGIALVFAPQLMSTTLDDATLRGIGLSVFGAWLASLGNMAAVRNTKAKLPAVAINAHGMFWGGLASLLVAAVLGRSFAIDWTVEYTASLAYLALFGSAVAFGSYLFLIEHIGSGPAAYANIVVPIVALVISTVFESYQWTWLAALGVLLVLGGNTLIINRQRNARRAGLARKNRIA
ncbi:MAG: EamA family transporter [Pseudomonadota bacterium]